MQSIRQAGDRREMRVEDIAYGGDGVGRMDGMAVFVPFVMTGEQVEVEIVSVHKRHARARLVRIIDSAADRVPAECPYYTVCAGCQYQHMRYALQVRAKEAQLRELLRRIGRVPDAPMLPMAQAPDVYGYRTKITLHGPGRPAYVGHDHGELVPIDACPLARPEINDELKQWIVAHPQGLKEQEDLHFRVDMTGRAWTYGGASTRLITQRVCGRDFDMPLSSFFQVNPPVAELLVASVRDFVRDSGCRTLFDIYCGVGVFGLVASPIVEQVWGVESDAEAVRVARRNAKKQGVPHARFLADSAENGFLRFAQECKGVDVCCVLDPPRAGCEPAVLRMLAENRVKAVVYVSCAPDKLARDTRVLLDSGYQLTHVQPFDMFPQTAHFETVAVFKGE